ncbi:MAG: hypothetical protein R2568_11300 [Candidatus Scalindua sp.]|jgi:hypothetical protein|nr:hypothetical protein [Candidatus Scalindua sp.]MDV5167312.1 hypothetical protein [Candidatus Scalindua sp.]
MIAAENPESSISGMEHQPIYTNSYIPDKDGQFRAVRKFQDYSPYQAGAHEPLLQGFPNA